MELPRYFQSGKSPSFGRHACIGGPILGKTSPQKTLGEIYVDHPSTLLPPPQSPAPKYARIKAAAYSRSGPSLLSETPSSANFT